MSTTASDSRPAEDIPITTCVSGAKPEENRSARREDAAIAGDSEQQEYPSGPKFGLMVFALCLGGFLVSLVSLSNSQTPRFFCLLCISSKESLLTSSVSFL